MTRWRTSRRSRGREYKWTSSEALRRTSTVASWGGSHFAKSGCPIAGYRQQLATLAAADRRRCWSRLSRG